MMLVADLIAAGPVKPVLTLPADTRLADALDAMCRGQVTAAIVLDSGRPCGILTRGDLLRGLAAQPIAENSSGLLQRLLSEVMSTDLLTAVPEKTLPQAIEHMTQAGIEHLPVMQGDRLIAVLHLDDLLVKQIRMLNAEITHLQQYIETLHHAEKD